MGLDINLFRKGEPVFRCRRLSSAASLSARRATPLSTSTLATSCHEMRAGNRPSPHYPLH